MLNNFRSNKLYLIIMVVVLISVTAVFLCNTTVAVAESDLAATAGYDTKETAKTSPSNFVTTRTTGMLNGTLQKQTDGSVTFNGDEIASAEENLSQMYVILQGAGGAGGTAGIRVDSDGHLFSSTSGGGSGAFVVVLIKFKPLQDINGNTYFLPAQISSGSGAMMSETSSFRLIKEGADSVLSIEGIGSITAKTGLSAYTAKKSPTLGGAIEVNSISDDMTDYMEIVHQQTGKTSNENNTSHIFTVNMYKNGDWLTPRTFGTYLGGFYSHGGGASPYSKGGNGAYTDLISIYFYPENAPSYGAGGGGPLFIIPGIPNCDGDRFGTGGDGGDGFIEILG